MCIVSMNVNGHDLDEQEVLFIYKLAKWTCTLYLLEFTIENNIFLIICYSNYQT